MKTQFGNCHLLLGIEKRKREIQRREDAAKRRILPSVRPENLDQTVTDAVPRVLHVEQVATSVSGVRFPVFNVGPRNRRREASIEFCQNDVFG